MGLLDNKVIDFTFKHASQADIPTPSFASSAAFKTALDSQAKQLQTGLNGAIDWLATNGAPGIFVNPKDPAYKASGSAQTTTGSITAGSNIATLTAPIDFIDGQGIAVNHAGAACTLVTPGIPTVTPTGTAGTTAYQYQIVAVDANGGCTAAGTAGTTSTGNAALSTTNYNILSWTSVINAVLYAIYGRVSGTMVLLGLVTGMQFSDVGGSALTPPSTLPSSAPATSLADTLVSTISSGSGSTSLTLATNATTTATTQSVSHEDTAAVQAAINAAIAAGAKAILFPHGTYKVTALTGLSSVVLFGDNAVFLGISTIINQIGSNTSLNLRTDGDSFGLYLLNTRSGNLFSQRVARAKNFNITNSNVNGSEANNVWRKISTEVPVPSPYNYHLLNVGFNDARKYGNIAYITADIANKIKNIVAFLSLGSITDSSNGAIVYTGTWTLNNGAPPGDFYGNSLQMTTVQNSYAEYIFTGDKVTVGTFGLNGAAATMELKVDGAIIKTVSLSNQGGNSGTTGTYANMAIILTNLGAGSHTLRVTKTDATTNTMFLDWIGIPAATPPVIIVNGITKMITAQYALNSPFDKATDALMLSTNKAIRESLADFDEKVIFIDQSDFDPNNYNVISTDGVHPNDYGHEWIASNILKRL